MTEHHANICPTQSHVGTTLCIRGGWLTTGDTVVMTCPDAPDAIAIVRQFSPGRLSLGVGDRMLVCRPWQAGDPPVERLPGTNSSWLVEQVETACSVEEADS